MTGALATISVTPLFDVALLGVGIVYPLEWLIARAAERKGPGGP